MIHRCLMNSISFGIPNFESPPPSPSMEVAVEVFSNSWIWSLHHHPHRFILLASLQKSLRNSLWIPPMGKDTSSPVRGRSQHGHLRKPHPGVTAPSPAPLSDDEHVQLGGVSDAVRARLTHGARAVRTLPPRKACIVENTPSTGHRLFTRATMVFLPHFGTAMHRHPN